MSTAPVKQVALQKASAAASAAKKHAKRAAAKPTRSAAMKRKVTAARRVNATNARPVHSESRLAQVLVGPIVSEKATLVSEKRNQVTFKVLRDATKPEIKAAVELLFKVEVDSVQTAVQKGKVKKFGRSMGRRDHVKKAYVALKAGQELNFSGEGA